MKRILVVILLFALVPGTLLAQKKESGKVRTLVIDPGHGGDKPGAIGKHCQEKDLTLAIAKNWHPPSLRETYQLRPQHQRER